MKFDIVTPSYNQGEYLRETMDSVLSQEGSAFDIDYYVLDGGSGDGSKALIKSYESKLKYWRSSKDAGQAAAIAEGLAMGDGEIVTWINSDDVYPPGVFKRVADFFEEHPKVDVIYGDCLMIDEVSNPVGVGTHISVTWEDLFETPYLINQESTFFRRALYEKVGGVDADFWGAMDYDLWLRLFHAGNASYLPQILGGHRFLPNQKSATSERYVTEMQKARKKFAKCHCLETPPWPFSAKGQSQIQTKWELQWQPILEWIDNGCQETDFREDVADAWNNYAQQGVLSVKGGTSFGWVGPDALYILDRDMVGASIDWLFSSPARGLSARRLFLNVESKAYQIELNVSVQHRFDLCKDKRFSVVRMTADRSFVPAVENWGPTYFYLSLVSCPRPNGQQILSIQSIPCLPGFRDYRRLELGRERVRDVNLKDEIQCLPKKTHAWSKRKKRNALKIAFFTSHPAGIGSGSERLIYQTAKGLIERGHDVRVYVMNSHLDESPPFFVYQMPKVLMEKAFERGLARLTGWNDLFFLSTPLLRIRRWLRSADIWHFHNLHGHYVSIPMLSLLSWTKHIIVSPVDQYLSTGHCPYPVDCNRYLSGCGDCKKLNEPWPGISRDSTRTLWMVKRVSISLSRFQMIFHTQALADHYKNTFVSTRPGRVIHYGVDIQCFRPLIREECRLRLGLAPTSRFVVGLFHSYVLDRRKGILPLVHRLGELAREFPGDIELLVVGHGGDAVKEVVPTELAVTVLPFLRRPHELANALNLCDVLLYPTQAENLSLTCLDALACGIPVISYDAGGQREAIINGHNGFIVDINNEENMVSRLKEVMKGPDLCRRLSENARVSAEKWFDFDRYVDELIEYYEAILR